MIGFGVFSLQILFELSQRCPLRRVLTVLLTALPAPTIGRLTTRGLV